MALLATQAIVIAGTTATYAAASAGGDTVAPGRSTYLHVKNGGGAPITVTIGAYPNATTYGAAVPDLVVTVANGAEKKIGPLWPEATFANPTTGVVDVSYSAVTSVTVGAFAI